MSLGPEQEQFVAEYALSGHFTDSPRSDNQRIERERIRLPLASKCPFP
jgi:hypothetical protein